MRKKILQMQTAYREGIRILTDADIADAAVDAWHLLEFTTGVDRLAYYADPDQEMTKEQLDAYFQYIKIRRGRMPLQHITGRQEFMGYTFQVSPDVLVPRQDTEVLVEEAIKKLRPGMRILDLCTGSGCILLSILKMGREKHNIKGLKGTGTDLSEPALAIAERNAQALGLGTSGRAEGTSDMPVQFICSDLYNRVEGRYDLILSNPPYIPTDVISGLEEEVRCHDPYMALDGGEDGLTFYRDIIAGSACHLEPNGLLLFEIGYDQGDAVRSILKEAGYTDIHIKKDLAGLDRVVSGRYNKTCNW